MKQLSAGNIPDLQARKIDIYATIIIAIAIGLATLTPVESALKNAGVIHSSSSRQSLAEKNLLFRLSINRFKQPSKISGIYLLTNALFESFLILEPLPALTNKNNIPPSFLK